MPYLTHVARTTADPAPARLVPIGYWMHRGGVPFVSPKIFKNIYWATVKPIIEELWSEGHQTLFYAEGKWDRHLCLIDTAGLRDSDDLIEKEGIKRAWQEVRRADCLLMVIDASLESQAESELSNAMLKVLPANVPMIQVFNKIDQRGEPARVTEMGVYLCARTGEGISLLHEKIEEAVGYQPMEGQFLARRRHLDALDRAKGLLTNGHQQLNVHRAGELLAEDLRLAHLALCEITGEFTPDDLLGKIFSSFCIGK